MSTFRDEVKLISPVAWVIALGVLVVIPLSVILYTTFAVGQTHGFFAIPLIFLSLACIVAFFYVLALGYIAADARRRGMSAVLWVLLSIFIPNAIGIVLYFILRHPLQRTCPNCKAAVDAAFAFCSACGTSLAKACPSCKSAVEPSWSHCSRCGAPL